MNLGKTGPRAIWVIFLLLVAAVILFSRRPEGLTQAQFWAEDGRVWYADSYNLGNGKAFLLTQDGYFQTLSRAASAVSQLFPVAAAPLVFNVVALGVYLLPLVVLFAERFDKLISSFKVRLLLAFLYVALPNTAQVQGNLTNAQWLLAIGACLVLLAETSSKFGWRAFDVCVVALSGLSGPFAIFCSPWLYFGGYGQKAAGWAF